MPNPDPARYHDADGTRHTVRVQRNPQGRWDVVDIAGDHRRVIDTLLGSEEARGEAQALARDYAAQHDVPDAPHDRRPPPKRSFSA